MTGPPPAFPLPHSPGASWQEGRTPDGGHGDAAGRHPFPHDATLVLCTDGVTEARNADGDFYPLRARLRTWGELPPEQLTATLHADLAAQRRGKRDSCDTPCLVDAMTTP
ncbi:SpoIIE family protein phosphatase [Microtetraspora malaysiensis]|uniref:SpoIIE family protein phosphatase n=1 Tax=Microtetraspora malaysiensis TaxID=161358 RepID=UPI003D8C91B9